jgi:hypothetical protein
LNSSASPALERIINHAIEKEREQRYQSAGEMRAQLLDLPELQPVHTASHERRRSRLWFAASTLLLLLAVALVIVLRHG